MDYTEQLADVIDRLDMLIDLVYYVVVGVGLLFGLDLARAFFRG